MAKKKPSPSLPLYRNLAMSFAALTVLLVVVILYFSVARATVLVTAHTETIPLERSVTVAARPTEHPGALAGKVIARAMTREESFSTTLGEEVDTKARGSIRIMNEGRESQALIARTRFLSESGVLFRLLEPTRVPAGGEATATIVADVAGVAGEVSATRWTVPGLAPAFQKIVYGISDAAMTGGRTAVYRVTKEDIDRARTAVEDGMTTAVRQELTEGMDDVITSFTVQPKTSDVSEEVGAEVRTFTVAATADFEGMALPWKGLEEWIQRELLTSIADDQRLLPLDRTGWDVTIADINAETGTATLLVRGEGRSVLRNTSTALDRQRMVGRTPDQVEALLEAHGGIQSVDIRLTPRVLRRFPRIPDHIKIEIVEPK